MRDFCLLDYLAWKLHLVYLSDLRKLSLTDKRRIADILSKLTDFTEFYPVEWLDACEYLTGRKAETAETARMQMLEYFSEARK